MTKLFKYSAGMALGLLLLMSPAAHAAISPASVLAINTDTSNSKLYVEISYEGRPCLVYQLKFGIGIFDAGGNLTGDTTIARPFKVVTGAGDDVVWKDGAGSPPANGYITRVEGNVTTGDTLMYDMQISGYRLEFDLATLNGGGRVLPTDSIKVCLRSQMKPIECKGCGTAGSDRMFSLNDIAAGCPYDYQNKEDMIACYQRDSKVANWEGWMVDARDCQRYRTVQMPDGKWWLAQNLNFQGTTGNPLTYKSNYKTINDLGTTNDLAELNGLYWCPPAVDRIWDTIPLTDSALAHTIGSKEACNTYGALYSSFTIFLKDGKTTGALTTASSDFMAKPFVDVATSHKDTVGVRGICPEGWLIPTQHNWGKLLNLVEKNCEDTSKHYGCTTTGENSLATSGFPILGNDSAFRFNPCKHINTGDPKQQRWTASACAYKDLLSTNVAPYREMDTVPNYIGAGTSVAPWNMVKNRRLLAAPKRIKRYATESNPVWSYFYPETAGTDKYGFSILPVGLRDQVPLSLFFGEMAAFWTSTIGAAITDGGANNAFQLRAFIYNAQINPIMPHAVFTSDHTISKMFGLSLRCVADNTK